MSSNSDDIQVAGSDTRHPMLDRTDYESWSQRIRLYCRGKENGLQILQSIDQGPFELGTTRDALGTTPEGGVLLGPERPRTYEDLSDTEKKQYDADVCATNIVLQGLPKDIYKLINQNIEAKAIWDNVKMLLDSQKKIESLSCTMSLSDSRCFQVKISMSTMFTFTSVTPPKSDMQRNGNLGVLLGSTNPQAGPSNASILSEVHILENAIDHSVSNQDEHEIHNKVQPSNVIDSTSVHIGNNNVIPYEQYLSVNDNSVVPSYASSALNSVCVSPVNDAIVYDQKTKTALGAQNPFYLRQAKKAQPALYDGDELLKPHHVPVIVPTSEEELELAEATRNKRNVKMNDSACVEKRVNITPPNYSKENFMATFTPQTQLIPEQVFWSLDLAKRKAEELKANATPMPVLPLATMYPPNLPHQLSPSKTASDYKSSKYYPIDLDPISPRLKKNQEVHLYYIKRLKESVETLHEIVEDAKIERPLDTYLASAFRYTKHSQELLEY
ncbi:hypothetical protein Tco_1409945 [Tanacetum coccineum]